jgi:hypothetical protein
MTRHIPLLLALLTAIAVAPSPPLGAAEGATPRTSLAACQGDVAKLCPGVAPGTGQLARCLAGNREQVSSACRSQIAATTEVRGAIGACMSDVTSHCAGIMPGGGRIVACLIAKNDVISTGCKSAISAATAALDR